MSVRIAIDCMGGDHGLSVTIPAALAFIDHVSDAQVILVGLADEVNAALAFLGDAPNPSAEAWSDLAHAIFLSTEFRYLR